MMNGKIRVAVSGLCGTALAAAMVLVTPSFARTHTTPAQQEAAPQAQSVSGTIASVARNSFTLSVGENPSTPTNAPAQQMQQTTPKTMTFLVNQNTTIDGKLKVGSAADVTYREDNGSNVAISVHVAK